MNQLSDLSISFSDLVDLHLSACLDFTGPDFNTYSTLQWYFNDAIGIDDVRDLLMTWTESYCDVFN